MEVRTRIPRVWPNGSAVFSPEDRSPRLLGQPDEDRRGLMGRVVRRDGQAHAYSFLDGWYRYLGAFDTSTDCMSAIFEVYRSARIQKKPRRK